MRNLFVFGDSFTQGHLLDTTFPPYHEWKEYRGTELPLPWPDLLARQLGYIVHNYAVAGMSNHEIFQEVCRHVNEFSSGDIVIINWTYNHRFRWVIWDDDLNVYRWKRMSAKQEDGICIPETVRDNIVLNRTNKLYIDEIYEREDLLEHLSWGKNIELFFWSSVDDIINDLPNVKLLNKKYILHNDIVKLPPTNISGQKKRTFFDVITKHGGKTITEETNEKVFDGGHLGETGHQTQARLFYEYIRKYSSHIFEKNVI